MLSFARPAKPGGSGMAGAASSGSHDWQLAVHLAQKVPGSGKDEKAFREAIVACGRAKQWNIAVKMLSSIFWSSKASTSTASMPRSQRVDVGSSGSSRWHCCCKWKHSKLRQM